MQMNTETDITSYTKWRKETFSLIHPRGAALQALDDAIKAFDNAKTVENFGRIEQTYGTWISAKGENGSSRDKNKHRPVTNLGNAIAVARATLDRQASLDRPASPDSQVSKASKERFDTLTELAESWRNPHSNRVMWNDSWDQRIVDRDPRKIKAALDATVAEMGGIETAKQLFGGADPYAITQPVCGVSANNMFKLMTEKDQAVNPLEVQYHDGKEFARHLDSLDPDKNHVVMVDDARLGHKFLIDLPASHGGPRQAFIVDLDEVALSPPNPRKDKAFVIQSDLGEGALPPLNPGDWIKTRGNDSMKLDDLKRLISPGFAQESPDAQGKLLASILDINKDPARVDVEKLHLDKTCRFASSEYDFEQFRQNVRYVCEVGKQLTQAEQPLQRRPGSPSHPGGSAQNADDQAPQRRAGSPPRPVPAAATKTRKHTQGL